MEATSFVPAYKVSSCKVLQHVFGASVSTSFWVGSYPCHGGSWCARNLLWKRLPLRKRPLPRKTPLARTEKIATKVSQNCIHLPELWYGPIPPIDTALLPLCPFSSLSAWMATPILQTDSVLLSSKKYSRTIYPGCAAFMLEWGQANSSPLGFQFDFALSLG